MKRVLLGLMIVSLFSMCTGNDDDENMDLRSDGEIALSRLTSAFDWTIQKFTEYDCENLDLIRESNPTDSYSMSFISNGEYQLVIGTGVAGEDVVITGKWTFISKIDEDTYKFENRFSFVPENIPPLSGSPLLMEGTYNLEFRSLPGQKKDGLMVMIPDACTNSIREGFEWEGP